MYIEIMHMTYPPVLRYSIVNRTVRHVSICIPGTPPMNIFSMINCINVWHIATSSWYPTSWTFWTYAIFIILLCIWIWITTVYRRVRVRVWWQKNNNNSHILYRIQYVSATLNLDGWELICRLQDLWVWDLSTSIFISSSKSSLTLLLSTFNFDHEIWVQCRLCSCPRKWIGELVCSPCPFFVLEVLAH